MSNHTPGRWVAEAAHDDEKTKAPLFHWIAVLGDGGFHERYVGSTFAAKDPIADKANAHLIAAAPDLLAAAKALSKKLSDPGWQFDEMTALRAAIAKAEAA